MPNCDVCYQIADALRTGEFDSEINLGTYGEMKNRTDCVTCQQIASDAHAATNADMTALQSRNLELLRHREPSSEYQIVEEDYTDLLIDIIPLISNMSQSSVGILIDREWIDMERVKSWLTYCECNHGSSCYTSSGKRLIPVCARLILIDVQQGCLVQQAGDVRYLALSYVWGQRVGVAEARVSNFSKLSTSGAITADSKDFNLPETIRDAIRLVRILGERFLWVDRLCIVQDDLETKCQAIQEMASVYANALCTIVAAAGIDASHGLRGIGSGSKPRNCQQEILLFPDCPVLIQQAPNAEQQSVWYKRGWTYQEQLFSRRLLVFSGETVFWRCQQSEFREDLTAEPEGALRPPVSDREQLLLQPLNYPDLSLFGNLAGHYNRRHLSFESDIRDAFAGIENILGQAFPGGICNGLPELFFDKALLWQPLRPMKRRRPELSSERPLEDPDYLPSWSWLGWKGDIDPLKWNAGFDYPEYLPTSPHLSRGGTISSEKVFPVAQWTQLEAKAGEYPDICGPQRDIQNDYYRWREAAFMSKPGAVHQDALAQGWCRSDEDTSQCWYTHPRIENVRFKYPVPLQSLSLVSHTKPTSSFPALRLRSSCTFLRIDERIQGLDMRRTLSVSLKDKAGAWAGVLRLNILFSSPLPTDVECELVAISLGSVRNDGPDEHKFFEEWNLKERPRDSVDYEFYNVFWIQRMEDGCVTRRALGRVCRHIWDGAHLEEFDAIMR